MDGKCGWPVKFIAQYVQVYEVKDYITAIFIYPYGLTIMKHYQAYEIIGKETRSYSHAISSCFFLCIFFSRMICILYACGCDRAGYRSDLLLTFRAQCTHAKMN